MVLLALPIAGATAAQDIRVAAAADLKFAMQDVAAQFETKTGRKVDVTYGSSGNFFSQLQNGAPFDLFFSADIDYPRKLESAGFAEPGGNGVQGGGEIPAAGRHHSRAEDTSREGGEGRS